MCTLRMRRSARQTTNVTILSVVPMVRLFALAEKRDRPETASIPPDSAAGSVTPTIPISRMEEIPNGGIGSTRSY
jgi:hypothetical protein